MTIIAIGLPVCVKNAAYGRVLSLEGGIVTVITPGGSVIRSGLVWVASLDDQGMAQLRYYESMPSGPNTYRYDNKFSGIEDWKIPVPKDWTPTGAST